MTSILRRNGALALWLVALAFLVAGEALTAANRLAGNEGWEDIAWLSLLGGFLFSTIGALILSRYPGHAIGWLLYVVGTLFVASFFLTEYALYTLVTNPGVLPFGIAAGVISYIGGTAFFLLTSLLLLLFPDGKTLSARWNVVLVFAAVGVVCASASEFLAPGPFQSPLEQWDNPIGIEGAGEALDALNLFGLVVVGACGLAGATSLVLRFRRSTGVQQEQLKWVAFAGVLFICLWIFAVLGVEAGLFTLKVQNAIILFGISSIPFAAGIAILRYRLYDIDWIINRTLVYVPLTAILAGIYIALTGIFRTVVTDSTGDNSDFAIALTTVLVVAMLTPLKNYLQERVDKRFKESNDPARQLQKLIRETRTAAEILDRDRYLQRFLEKITTTMQAESGVIELEPDGRMLIAGDWQDDAVIECALVGSGPRTGRLCIGRRRGGRPYTEDEEAALREAGEVVGYLLTLETVRPAEVSVETK